MNGTVAITPTSIPGDTLTITVNDADLNADTGAVDTVDVQVENEDTGELETITLTETGVNTGVFTGTIDTQFGTATEGNLTNGLFNHTRTREPNQRVGLGQNDVAQHGKARGNPPPWSGGSAH